MRFNSRLRSVPPFTAACLLFASCFLACGKDSCSGSDRSRKVECGGTMDNGAFWGTAYNEHTDLFVGGLWCGGQPDPGNPRPPDKSCAGPRAAVKKGKQVVCIGYPDPGSTDIPQIRISCD